MPILNHLQKNFIHLKNEKKNRGLIYRRSPITAAAIFFKKYRSIVSLKLSKSIWRIISLNNGFIRNGAKIFSARYNKIGNDVKLFSTCKMNLHLITQNINFRRRKRIWRVFDFDYLCEVSFIRYFEKKYSESMIFYSDLFKRKNE